MKLIKAIIKPNRLEDVRTRLIASGILGMTASECVGHGKSGPTVPSLRCEDKELRVLQTMMLIEVAVTSEQLKAAIQAITRGARLGLSGDGKIFVCAVDLVVRIRTDERDHAALVGSLEAEVAR